MNIPIEIVVVFMGAIVAGQGWILVEVVRLKIKVAVLTARVHRGAKHEPEDEDDL